MAVLDHRVLLPDVVAQRGVGRRPEDGRDRERDGLRTGGGRRAAVRGRERRSGRRVREEAWEEAWEGGAGSGRGAAACLVLGELSEHREERHEDRAAARRRQGYNAVFDFGAPWALCHAALEGSGSWGGSVKR